MRRLYLAFALGIAMLAATASTTSAQTIGFKLGASFANLSEDGTTIGGLTGFAGGGFVRFGMGRIGVQAELLTVTKGAEEDEDVAGAGKLQLEYVEIPLLLHLPLTMGASFAPYVFAGPSAAFEVRCSSEGAHDPLICDEPRKSMDFGLHVGGGLAFDMGPGAILVEGRYNWGLTDLDDSGHGHNLKTRTAMIMAGYAIPLSR